MGSSALFLIIFPMQRGRGSPILCYGQKPVAFRELHSSTIRRGAIRRDRLRYESSNVTESVNCFCGKK